MLLLSPTSPCNMGSPSLPQIAPLGLWAGSPGSLCMTRPARIQRRGEGHARSNSRRNSPPLIPWRVESLHSPTRTCETRKPMTAEQQLERSVLEGKERDELHAIAQALSVKTNTRTKKADIIDSILRAAGVAVDDGPAASRCAGGEKCRSANGAHARRDHRARADGAAPPLGPPGRPNRKRAGSVAVRSFGPADDAERAGRHVDARATGSTGCRVQRTASPAPTRPATRAPAGRVRRHAPLRVGGSSSPSRR